MELKQLKSSSPHRVSIPTRLPLNLIQSGRQRFSLLFICVLHVITCHTLPYRILLMLTAEIPVDIYNGTFKYHGIMGLWDNWVSYRLGIAPSRDRTI